MQGAIEMPATDGMIRNSRAYGGEAPITLRALLAKGIQHITHRRILDIVQSLA
jgi:hypothetical protein